MLAPICVGFGSNKALGSKDRRKLKRVQPPVVQMALTPKDLEELGKASAGEILLSPRDEIFCRPYFFFCC